MDSLNLVLQGIWNDNRVKVKKSYSVWQVSVGLSSLPTEHEPRRGSSKLVAEKHTQTVLPEVQTNILCTCISFQL